MIDLIDQKRTGILSVLTDQCRAPRGTDGSFCNVMYKTCDSMPRFEATNLQRGHKHFTLVHYGVPVTYETDGFVEKNKDDIPRGASKLLKSSSKDFVKFLGMMMDNSAEASGGASDSDSPRASAKKIQPFSFLPQSSLIRLQLILLWNRRRGGHLHLSLSFIVSASLHFALLCGCLAPTLAGSL